MLAPLRKPLLLPTNSRSSFACSTTRAGCRTHRPRNWALSTLPGEDAHRLQHTPRDPGPPAPSSTRARRRTGEPGAAGGPIAPLGRRLGPALASRVECSHACKRQAFAQGTGGREGPAQERLGPVLKVIAGGGEDVGTPWIWDGGVCVAPRLGLGTMPEWQCCSSQRGRCGMEAVTS